MSRPSDLSKYVEGDPCKKCGGRLYRRKTVCVECERRANARRYATRVGNDYVEPAPIPRISPSYLAHAMEGYRRSPTALQRSAHLDALVRSRFAKLLGDDSDQEVKPIVTADDQHRQQLPRGMLKINVGVGDRDKADMEARYQQNEKLRKVIKQMLPTFPDIMSGADIMERLAKRAPDLLATINRSRLQWAIGSVLRDLHIPRRPGSGRQRFYIVRNGRRYAGLGLYGLKEAKAGQLPQPRAVSGRSSISERRSDTPGSRKATPRASKWQRETRATEAA